MVSLGYSQLNDIMKIIQETRYMHYIDVIMTTMPSQITSLTVVNSIVYSGADQRKHQSSVSLAFVRGIHRTGEFPAQMASNAENASIWWRHHGLQVDGHSLHSKDLVHDGAMAWIHNWRLGGKSKRPFISTD